MDDDGSGLVAATITITKTLRERDVMINLSITPELPVSEVMGILSFALHSFAIDNIEPAPKEYEDD